MKHLHTKLIVSLSALTILSIAGFVNSTYADNACGVDPVYIKKEVVNEVNNSWASDPACGGRPNGQHTITRDCQYTFYSDAGYTNPISVTGLTLHKDRSGGCNYGSCTASPTTGDVVVTGSSYYDVQCEYEDSEDFPPGGCGATWVQYWNVSSYSCDATGGASPVSGVCGSSNGQSFTTGSGGPSSNLCNVGVPSSVNGAGPWNWLCYGSNGGSNASCGATVTAGSGSGGSCTPNWSCGAGYALTGDTNGDGTPNCIKTSCVIVPAGGTVYQYPYDRQEPAPINAGCSASEDGYSNSCATSFWNINCSISETASEDVHLDYTFRNGAQVCTVPVTISNGTSTAATTATCGCAIASTVEGESVTVTSPTNMNGKWFYDYFQWQTSTGVNIDSDITNCGCDNGGGLDCSTSTGVIQSSGTYGYCSDVVWDGTNYNYNIFGHNQPQSNGTTQTICSNDIQEATDANNCSGCVVVTDTPTVCDLNDPVMAGVCYVPGGFGTTVLVRGGNVGINTLTPSYPLDVDGSIRAAQILTLSDIRFKTSIEKIDNALEKISKINGYTFTWKDSGKPDLGVLAQEVEKVFADAVKTDENGKKTVQYNALLAPIIEAIRELNTNIDSLSNEKFDAQVKRIEAIESKVK